MVVSAQQGTRQERAPACAGEEEGYNVQLRDCRLTTGERCARLGGRSAGVWQQGTAAQTNEGCGIENGGGLPFYRAFGQLKGPQAAEEPQGRKFRYYSEIYALHQHISCKIKTKII